MVLSPRLGSGTLSILARDGGDLQRIASVREPGRPGEMLPRCDRCIHVQTTWSKGKRRSFRVTNASASPRAARPDVQVRAADSGAREADQDGSGLDLGHGILAQLELAAIRLQRCNST